MRQSYKNFMFSFDLTCLSQQAICYRLHKFIHIEVPYPHCTRYTGTYTHTFICLTGNQRVVRKNADKQKEDLNFE